jgi:hypothetical protein
MRFYCCILSNKFTYIFSKATRPEFDFYSRVWNDNYDKLDFIIASHRF